MNEKRKSQFGMTIGVLAAATGIAAEVVYGPRGLAQLATNFANKSSIKANNPVKQIR